MCPVKNRQVLCYITGINNCPMNRIRDMKKDRMDLSDFLIHFTRETPTHSSFEVLKSIVSDGVIKAGWSERGVRRTIFGSRPAVCFTETPLYGFVDYVAKRKDKRSIDAYGIALVRQDLFRAGARCVIYGTTLPPAETIDESGCYHVQGLAAEEQYRYILTSIDEKNDWTHEREWRWANWHGNSLTDALPVWKPAVSEKSYPEFFGFQAIVIIVQTPAQKNELMQMLATIHNTSDYYQDNIERTHILVLGECDFSVNPLYRIEQAITAGKTHRFRR